MASVCYLENGAKDALYIEKIAQWTIQAEDRRYTCVVGTLRSPLGILALIFRLDNMLSHHSEDLDPNRMYENDDPSTTFGSDSEN